MAGLVNRHVLITGTSRGIGLEMVRQWAADPGTRVYAACRNSKKAEELQQLKKQHANIEVMEMDVSDEGSIRHAFTHLRSSLSHVDLLINNAAIQSPRQPEDFITTATSADALRLYQTNVIGPMLIIQHALPLLRSPPISPSPSTPTVLNISSSYGSVSLTSDGNDATYKLSKAALNQMTRLWAGEVKDVAFIALDPGWVDTEMGSKGGRKPPLTAQQSVEGIKKIAEKATLKDTGKFLDFDGKTVPW